MNKHWTGMMWLAAALCFAGTGCGSDGINDGENGGKPALDVNGNWKVWEDGVHLGTMSLIVSDGGLLKGTLVTVDSSEAQLSGAMEGYVAEFSISFPTEYYEATLTFEADGSVANGLAKDSKGFTRILRAEPQSST
jgi:hypothetical protein